MCVATAPATVVSAAAGFFGGRTFPGVGRGEGGKFLVQHGGTAMRTLRPAPIGGAHQYLAVLLTFPTMKFVDWHEDKIISEAENSSCDGVPSIPTTNHGDNLSRCGKWSRFQRLKASSLVSSKRNFSVGDSTWPSQKTTLAQP